MGWHEGGLQLKLLSMEILWLGGKENTHSQSALENSLSDNYLADVVDFVHDMFICMQFK
jgi:hypothetical protein